MSVPSAPPPRPLSLTFGLTAAEARHSLILLGEAMVPKAQTIHPQQCMIITDAPGKPKAPVQVTCPSCGGQRHQDINGCPHCGGPAPKPREIPEPPTPPSGRKVLQDSLAHRKRQQSMFARLFFGGTESGGPS